MRVSIGGVAIDAVTLEEAVEKVVEHAAAGGPPAYVVTPNAQHLALLEDSPDFRRAYDEAWMRVADGVPLIWASRTMGRPLPGRVNGTDLFEEVCAAAAGRGVRVFLLGGKPGAADEAARVLRERSPGLEIAGTSCPPMGFERDPVESERVIAAIREAAPHVMFVGLGAPKQELWMRDNRERAGVPVSLGIGGSFEIVAGMVPRAPRWMQRNGLEWLYRLGREPRRLWKRYAVTNPRFAWIVAREMVRDRLSTPPGGP